LRRLCCTGFVIILTARKQILSQVTGYGLFPLSKFDLIFNHASKCFYLVAQSSFKGQVLAASSEPNQPPGVRSI